MIIKTHDSENFNLALKLDIDCELIKSIEVVVQIQNKLARTAKTKVFKPQNFKDALSWYDAQERFLFGAC